MFEHAFNADFGECTRLPEASIESQGSIWVAAPSRIRSKEDPRRMPRDCLLRATDPAKAEIEAFIASNVSVQLRGND